MEMAKLPSRVARILHGHPAYFQSESLQSVTNQHTLSKSIYVAPLLFFPAITNSHSRGFDFSLFARSQLESTHANEFTFVLILFSPSNIASRSFHVDTQFLAPLSLASWYLVG
jgi:hypothetical protein